MDDVKTVGQKEQMFSADIRITSHLKELESVFEELQSETKHPVKLNFERDEKLNDVLCSVRSFGSLKYDKKPQGVNFNTAMTKSQSINVRNKKVTAIEKTDVSCNSDTKTPWITGIAVLPRDQGILVCDHNNNTIKHLDADFNIIKCLHLSKPWDIEVFGASEAVITQPIEKKVQIIQVYPQLLISESEIGIDRKCWGIAVVDSDIFVSFHDTPGNGIIHVIDRKGILKRVLGKALSLEAPSYIFASPSSGRLYISDWQRVSVICITLDDKLVYEYKSSDLNGVRGIYVDESGNAVVCGRNTDNMYIVESDGKSHSTMLLANTAITGPYCVTCFNDHVYNKTKVIVGIYINASLYSLTLK